jgi:hypothetical protein
MKLEKIIKMLKLGGEMLKPPLESPQLEILP